MQRTAAWPPSAPDDEHQDGCEGPNYNVQAEQPLLSADDNSTQKDPENIERIDSERAEQQPAPPALQAAEERLSGHVFSSTRLESIGSVSELQGREGSAYPPSLV